MQFHGLRATVMESRLNTESKVCPMPGVASLGAPGMFPSHAHPIRPGMGEDLGIVSVVCTKDRKGKAMPWEVCPEGKRATKIKYKFRKC